MSRKAIVKTSSNGRHLLNMRHIYRGRGCTHRHIFGKAKRLMNGMKESTMRPPWAWGPGAAAEARGFWGRKTTCYCRAGGARGRKDRTWLQVPGLLKETEVRSWSGTVERSEKLTLWFRGAGNGTGQGVDGESPGDEEGENNFGEHDGREEKQMTAVPGLEFWRRERRTGVSCTAAEETKKSTSASLHLYYWETVDVEFRPAACGLAANNRGRTCSTWDRDVRSSAERCGAVVTHLGVDYSDHCMLFGHLAGISGPTGGALPSPAFD